MAASSVARSAVVDIGSNSVRMVAFDRHDRSLAPVFNEKAMSGLGRNLLATSRLDPAGWASALAILARFRMVAASMGVDRIRAVATAAVRDAFDGEEFVRVAEAALGAPVEVLAGSEEARLSGVGVLCGIPGAEGMIGDLGGGSLELAAVGGGRVGETLSLPIGPLALGDTVGARGEAKRLISALDAAPQGGARGQSLYVVGGAWRALAKHHFEKSKHPIWIIHEYDLAAEEAKRFAARVGATRKGDLGKLVGISGRRREFAPYSGRLLAHLIERLDPKRVVFSGYGLREGIAFEEMPADVRRRDPLIDHCRRLGRASARAPFDGDLMARWVGGAFEGDFADPRLVRAAAWLSDMSGSDHPDYRGHHAAARTLHLASAGIDHRERAFLAVTAYARYHGFGMEEALGDALKLLDDAQVNRAATVGLAFRLAHAIEPGDGVGGAPGLRDRFRLARRPGVLELHCDGVPPSALGETAERRFAALAKALSLEHRVVDAQSAAA